MSANAQPSGCFHGSAILKSSTVAQVIGARLQPLHRKPLHKNIDVIVTTSCRSEFLPKTNLVST